MTKVYFWLARKLLSLSSWCRRLGIHLDYYKAKCVKKAIYSSYMPSTEKDKVWAEYIKD